MDAQGNSEARIGWGTEFRLADAAGTLIEIDEVTEIPFAENMADDVEVTHFKSPGRKKEYRGGLIEPGTGSLVVNYIPGSETDTLLRAAHQAGTPRAFEAVLPDAEGQPAWRIGGFVIIKSRGPNVSVGDRMTQTVQVRFTGDTAEAPVA